jgi:hypothetical protein
VDKTQSFIDRVLEQIAVIKTAIIDVLRLLPPLDRLSEATMEWILICLIFITAITIIIPILKWSIKVSIFAAVFAGIAAFFTTASFWSLLPFTGLGIVLFSYANKGGRE